MVSSELQLNFCNISLAHIPLSLLARVQYLIYFRLAYLVITHTPIPCNLCIKPVVAKQRPANTYAYSFSHTMGAHTDDGRNIMQVNSVNDTCVCIVPE